VTSLRSQRRELPWRRDDGQPVGRRNPTVAALRATEPKRKRAEQRAYGPKGAAKLLRKHGVVIDGTRPWRADQ
jgi:hypothetical protein